MPYPRVQKIIDEYGLDLDDVRWYLSVLMSEKLASFQPEPLRLIEYIWSGRLADELFNLEERYLEELEANWDSGKTYEARVREFLMETRSARRRRRPPRQSTGAS